MRVAFENVALIASALVALISIGEILHGNQETAVNFFRFGECFCFLFFEIAKHYPMAK